MIETLDDIVEHLADRVGIYGIHTAFCDENDICRSCWVSHLKERIKNAMEIERKLA